MSIQNLENNLNYSGGFIPVLSSILNCVPNSPVIRYIKIGRVVHCSFFCALTGVVAPTNFGFNCTIPTIRSTNFLNSFDVSGCASGFVNGNITGNVDILPLTTLLVFNYTSINAGNGHVGASFSYEV